MIRSTFEEEMSRFEAEIGNKAASQLASNIANPFQHATQTAAAMQPTKYLGTTIPGSVFPSRPPMVPASLLNANANKVSSFTATASSVQQPSFQAPPSTPVVNNSASNTSFNPTSSFNSTSTGARSFISNKRPAVMSSAPTIYSAPATTKKQEDDDDDDILAILQKTEKEVKKEAKKSNTTTFKPSSVSASESNKKAKLMAQSVKASTTTTIKTVQVPQSTKDRMLALKSSTIESSSEATSSTSGTNLPGSVPSYDGIKAPAHASINDDTVKKIKKSKKIVRTGGGQIWEDPSLKEWDVNDFRIFCGDLGNDVTDEVLQRTFGRYPSFQKAKVIRDKKSNKTKGFGFVSFRDPADFTKAMREMNGKYVGSRPIKMRKSNWKDRNIEIVKQKQKTKQQMGYKW